MRREQTLKRDLSIIDLLQNHKGIENCISSYEIAKYLNEKGFNTKQKSIYHIMFYIKREYHLPICFLSSNGYFWANKSIEIKKTIDNLRSRINEMAEHIKLLESFLVE